MARLPVVASDSDAWGTVLNDYLGVAHNADGTLKSGAVGSDVLGFVNVKAPPYSAVGNGVTDDTTAIQNALNAGGVTFFPAGTYLTTQLTIPHAAVLRGVNSGTYNNTFSDAQRSRIKLKNSTNAVHINIPTTSNRVLISDLEFDGNDTNQSAGSWHGIVFAADSAQNEAQAVIERCYVHDYKGTGIYGGAWRQAVHLRDVVSNFNGEHGIQPVGTDWVIDSPICGDNTLDGVYVEGNTVDITTPALYNNRCGVNMASSLKRIRILGGNIDKNLRQGVFVSTGCRGVSVLGTSFTSNGRETNNTYPHIQVATTTGAVSILGCEFSGLESGVTNQSNYAIQLDASASALYAGNMYESGSVGGYTNAPERLHGSISGSTTYDPPSLATGAAANTTVTVTGAATGDTVVASHSSIDTAATSWIVTGYVSAANTVRVVILNVTGGTVDLGSGTLRVRVFKQGSLI